MKIHPGWIGALRGAAVLTAILAAAPFAVFAQDAPKQDAAAPQEELRALWIPAPSAPLMDAAAAEQMIKEVQTARFNTIMVQVRVYGDAYYASSVVARASSLSAAYPDPLAWIIEKAKIQSMKDKDDAPPLKVVAALEVLRVHSTAVRTRPSPDSILGQHPDWATLSMESKAVGPDQYYTLEPGLEPVRAHLAEVVRELATRYELDGIYLDGIRYPGTESKWGYHPAVLQKFREANPGVADRPSPTDPKWIEFRKDILATLVADLTAAIHEARPACQVFVGGEVVNPAPASVEQWEQGPVAQGMMQDWVAWGRKGIADWICIKNRQTGGVQSNPYEGWLAFVTRSGMQTKVCAGIEGGQNFNTQILSQIRATQNSGLGGIVLFDYLNPTVDNRPMLMAHLGNTVFARSRKVIKLMNIAYTPPVTQTPVGYRPTTPTLILASPAVDTPTTPTVGDREIAMEPEPTAAEPVATEAPTPAPTATPQPVLPTPTPLAVPMQTFRLKNGLSFKGRVVVEVDGKVTILTEDGAQLKIARNQILSPALE